MYYNFDELSEMLLINNFQSWKKDQHGEGDALWRTAIAYITTGDKKFYNGIIKAFSIIPKFNENGYVEDYHYQATRFNDGSDEYKDDVSRDQVILAWSSLYLNKDDRKLEELIKHTKYRLSKRYIMTPTMWLWSRGLIGNKFLGYLGQFFLTIELTFSVLFNILIKKLIGYKEYTLNEIEEMMKEPNSSKKDEKGENIRLECLNSKWKTFLWKVNFPGYGLHLAAWMNYTGSNGIFKSINNWLIGVDMAKHNLLLRLMVGKSVIEEEIEEFMPHEEWIWSQRNTKMNRNRVLPNNEDFAYDKEILRTIKKRNQKL